MYSILNDRVFWIYTIITLFVAIIGLVMLANINNYLLTVIWLLSLLLLLIVIYHLSNHWCPNQSLCIIDPDSQCFRPARRMWLIINLTYVVTLILMIVWVGEMANISFNTVMFAVLLAILALFLLCLSYNSNMIVPIYFSTALFAIWIIIALYLVVYF